MLKGNSHALSQNLWFCGLGAVELIRLVPLSDADCASADSRDDVSASVASNQLACHERCRRVSDEGSESTPDRTTGEIKALN
jgi:hypothetical protein